MDCCTLVGYSITSPGYEIDLEKSSLIHNTTSLLYNDCAIEYIFGRVEACDFIVMQMCIYCDRVTEGILVVHLLAVYYLYSMPHDNNTRRVR